MLSVASNHRDQRAHDEHTDRGPYNQTNDEHHSLSPIVGANSSGNGSDHQ